MECEHDFVFDELHGEIVCRKCGHVLTAEEKRRICDHGMELLETEETEEYISRKSAEGAVRDHWCDSSRTMGAITSIPAADVAPVVHGCWELIRGGEFTSAFKCSVCGRRVCVSCDSEKTLFYLKDRYPYCNCGAKMDGERPT